MRSTYLRLGSGELAAAVVFALIGVFEVTPHLTPSLRWVFWAALAPVLLILAQAGGFWLAARSWVLLRVMPMTLARLFAVAGVINVVVLVAGLTVVVVWGQAAWPRAWFIVIWLFGLLEFVNYFVVRLAYPVRRWIRYVRQWRRPRLRHDLVTGLRNGQ